MDESVTVVEWGRDRAEGLSESRLEITLERPIGGDAAEQATAELNGDAPAPWEIEDEEEAAAPRIVTLRWVGPRWNDAAVAGLRASLAGFVDAKQED